MPSATPSKTAQNSNNAGGGPKKERGTAKCRTPLFMEKKVAKSLNDQQPIFFAIVPLKKQTTAPRMAKMPPMMGPTASFSS